MNKIIQAGFLLIFFLLGACKATHKKQQLLLSVKPAELYAGGRAVKNADGSLTLASSAAACMFTFEENQCQIYLQNIAPAGDYNYVNVEVDGAYAGRFPVKGNTVSSLLIKATTPAKTHRAVVSKATEAANGQVIVTKMEGANIKKAAYQWKGKIECIGNSITCGFGNDLEIPCGNGSKWYDQHNAYWGYAARVAKANNLQLTISAISGAGMYRYWNANEPTVPGQYENALLNGDTTAKWNFQQYVPDIVTIALGTNDMSDGDGKTQRAAFDKTIFITAYKKFIKSIYAHYGKVQLVLLNSPMVGGERGKILEEAILTIKSEINEEMKPVKLVQHFFFQSINPTGCTYHPSIEEHRIMADQLAPFIKTLL